MFWLFLTFNLLISRSSSNWDYNVYNMYTIKYRTAANAKYIGLLAHSYSHRNVIKVYYTRICWRGRGIAILIKWPSKLTFCVDDWQCCSFYFSWMWRKPVRLSSILGGTLSRMTKKTRMRTQTQITPRISINRMRTDWLPIGFRELEYIYNVSFNVIQV